MGKIIAILFVLAIPFALVNAACDGDKDEQPTRPALAEDEAPTPPAPVEEDNAPMPAAPAEGDVDLRTCSDLEEALGPYVEGIHPEYDRAQDWDGDGISCE